MWFLSRCSSFALARWLNWQQGQQGKWDIKKTFAGGFLANDAAFTKTGTGSSTVYQFDLNLNTSELNAEFVLTPRKA
jgi:hypothetical protein